jgi:hypothetical protein
MMPAVATASRRLTKRDKDVPIRFRKRIAELERYIGRKVPDSDTGRQSTTVLFDHYAWLPDGPVRMDRFLETAAAWMALNEREQMKRDALNSMRTYDAAELGELLGLTWAVRCEQRITTIRAIDAPPATVLEAQRKENDAAYQRGRRALKRELPRPAPANKRKADDLQKRRVVTIHAALPAAGSLPIADLCQILKRSKNGPFCGVSASSLPRVVRRVVERDRSSFRIELKANPNRPDLQAAMWVSKAISGKTMETNLMPNTVPRSARTPATAPALSEEEYRRHFEERLAQFTPDTAGTELPQWFNSAAERSLLEASGLARSYFLELANRRRHELLAQRRERSEA